MKIGMMWMDASDTTLTAKIERAAAYYSKKYGHAPNVCFLHPSMVAPKPLQVLLILHGDEDPDQIEIRTRSSIRPNYLWMGVAEQGGSHA